MNIGTAPAITLTVTAPGTTGTITNTASVAADEADPVSGNNSDTEGTTVFIPQTADLSVTKSGDPHPAVLIYGTLTYEITVTNLEHITAENVTVTDILPANVTYQSASGTGWSCSESAGVVTCDRPSLSVGTAPVITIVVTAPPTAQTLINNVTVSSDTTDPNTANNTDSVETMVISSLNLSIAKSDYPDPVEITELLEYTISVQNNSTWAGTNVLMTDGLPSGTIFHSVFGEGWNCVYQSSGHNVTCSYPSLPGSTTAPDITIRVIAPTTTGDITNVASVTADETSNSVLIMETTRVIDTTSPDPADLSIEKSDLPDPVKTGARLTYTLTVENLDTVPADNVVVSDTLPEGVTLLNASGEGWSCEVVENALTCTRPELLAQAQSMITITVLAPLSAGNISNYAAIASETHDDDLSNNTAAETTTVLEDSGFSADLEITKTDHNDPTPAGTLIRYDLVITNHGPDPANNVMIIESLPESTTFLRVKTTGDYDCIIEHGVVACTIATLPTGQAPTLIIEVLAPALPGDIENTASVASDTPDPDPVNNLDTETTTVTALGSEQADLLITKADSDDPALIGTTLTYTLSITNLGPDTASLVGVLDSLPEEVIFHHVSADEWDCQYQASEHVVICSLPELAPGSAPDISITVITPDSNGVIENSAYVVASGANSSDPVPANNVAAEETTISATYSQSADLSIAKAISPDPVNAGATMTYTLTVTNNGPDPAQNIQVSDHLPEGVLIHKVTGTGWTCEQVSGDAVCSLPTLNSGSSSEILITAIAPDSAGDIINEAVVGSSVADPDISNNITTLSTSVMIGSTEAELAVEKTAQPEPVPVNARLTYTLTITNHGPDTAENLVLTDHIPSGTTLININQGDWDCEYSAPYLSCSLDQLAASSTTTIIITMISPENEGTITNTVVVSSSTTDTDTANNLDSVSSTVEVTGTSADLSIIGLITQGSPVSGEEITLGLTVTNHGPDTAHNILVIDTLPEGATLVSVTRDAWTCEESDGMVYCELTSLAGNTTSVLELVITLPAAAGELSNTAEVYSEITDDDLLNNLHMLAFNVDEPYHQIYVPLVTK
jgi:uncharacterized repeat protein (TIGR01451 family)